MNTENEGEFFFPMAFLGKSPKNHSVVTFLMNYYVVGTSSFTKKNIRFDFDDELKIGDVRYKHLT